MVPSTSWVAKHETDGTNRTYRTYSTAAHQVARHRHYKLAVSLFHPKSAKAPIMMSIRRMAVKGRANAESLGRSHLCHREERSDEAISTPSVGDCFASLAMTYRAVLSDFVFALLCRVAPQCCPAYNGELTGGGTDLRRCAH